MAVCDKWVLWKTLEFLFCVACLVTKRVSSDDEARLALLLQKLSREWSLLTSVTWDSVGGSFADAIYGGYVIITFGLLMGRVFQEIPRGRRILEAVLLGFGLLFFLVLGGLELASLDSVPHNLIVNASVLGALSLLVAGLFLVDLMGPRVYTAAHHSQTDSTTAISPTPTKKVTIAFPPTKDDVDGPSKTNGQLPNGKHNGYLPNAQKNGYLTSNKLADLESKLDTMDEDIKENKKKYEQPPLETDLEKSKYGSLRSGIEGGNYFRLSDPLLEPDKLHDRLHYERELAKFNEEYFRNYLEVIEGKFNVKENYLPEPQTPLFAKIKPGRLMDSYEDLSPSYEKKMSAKSPTRIRTVATPTLQQLEDYLKQSNRIRRADTPVGFGMEPIDERSGTADPLDDRASGTPTDPGFVQYSANKWPDKQDLRTPRHSPTH